jgi:hypothetical protein
MNERTFEDWLMGRIGTAPEITIAETRIARAAWKAATQVERVRCENVAIDNQRPLSTMPTVHDCALYNEACRDVAAAILKGD